MHHRAAARFPHVGNRSTNGVNQGLKVDLHDLIPNVKVDIEERYVFTEPEHTGNVGQVVDAAELIECSAYRFVYEVHISQVALSIDKLIACLQFCRLFLYVDCQYCRT
ncbi:hypothetical protein D3C76_1478410 [compost metagenome]